MNVGAHFTSHRLTSSGSRGKLGKFGKWKLVWPAGRANGARRGSFGNMKLHMAGCINNEPDFGPTECRCNFPITHHRYRYCMPPFNDLWVLGFWTYWLSSGPQWSGFLGQLQMAECLSNLYLMAARPWWANTSKWFGSNR